MIKSETATQILSVHNTTLDEMNIHSIYCMYQKNNYHCSTPFIWAFWQSVLSSVRISFKKKEKKAPEGLREIRFSVLMKPRLNSLASILSITSGGNQAPLSTCPVSSQQRGMVVADLCCGGFIQLQGQGNWSGLRGRLNRAKYRDTHSESRTSHPEH